MPNKKIKKILTVKKTKKPTAKKKNALKKTAGKTGVSKKKKTAKKKIVSKKAVKKKVLKLATAGLGQKIPIKLEQEVDLEQTAELNLPQENFDYQDNNEDAFSVFDFNDQQEDLFVRQQRELEPEDILESDFAQQDNEIEEIIEIQPNGRLTDSHKKIIMYVAIGSIMFAIISFWFIGVKNSLGESLRFSNTADELSPETQRIYQAFDNFKKDIESVGNVLDDVNKGVKTSTDTVKKNIILEQFKNQVSQQVQEKLEATQ